MDSLFIFILLYKNTPFFSNFYTKIDLENNKNIPDSLKNNKDIKIAVASIPQYFNDLYNNICKNSNSSNVAACRLNIRKNLNFIGGILANNTNMQAGSKKRRKKTKTPITSKVGNIGNYVKNFARDWLNDQQDSSELLEFLMYIYNINTNITYDINKCYEYNYKDKEYSVITEKIYTDRINKLSPSHRADYIANKLTYHVTTYAEQNLKLFDTDILDPIGNGNNTPPTVIKTYNNALIVFNKWDVINLTHKMSNKIEPDDDYIVVNYKINNPLPIFIIQINRLLVTNNDTQFNDAKINIPLHITNPDNKSHKYILIGGTIHYGGSKGGHYTAYILNPATNTYFYYDNNGGNWVEIGLYDKLITTDFSTRCTLIFYILESDYITQKQKVCRVTQETLESSSYKTASEKLSSITTPITTPITTHITTPIQQPIVSSHTVCTGIKPPAKCSATGLKFNVSGINTAHINFIYY
jgi:hypothetical protein